jgi:hypothetical protein
MIGKVSHFIELLVISWFFYENYQFFKKIGRRFFDFENFQTIRDFKLFDLYYFQKIGTPIC